MHKLIELETQESYWKGGLYRVWKETTLERINGGGGVD